MLLWSVEVKLSLHSKPTYGHEMWIVVLSVSFLCRMVEICSRDMVSIGVDQNKAAGGFRDQIRMPHSRISGHIQLGDHTAGLEIVGGVKQYVPSGVGTSQEEQGTKMTGFLPGPVHSLISDKQKKMNRWMFFLLFHPN